MRFRVIECDFLQVLLRKDQLDSLISEVSSTRVCMELDFLSIQIIKSQLCLWVSKIFSANLSKILQENLKNWFFPSFESSFVVKIEASSKKYGLGNSSRKQNWRKSTFNFHYR